MTLTELAEKYGSDKGLRGHGYTDTYDRLLTPLRDLPIKIFEIGVREGYSLKMWYDFFPNAKIYGIDINECEIHANDRTTIFKCDQGHFEGLNKIIESIGKIDIFIDDGSHKFSDIITSLEALTPYLNVGGFYFVEDIDPHQGKEIVKTYIRGLLDKDKELWLAGYFPSLKDTGEELGVIRT